MVTIFSPAKVNLFLAIQGKDASGYHLLDTIFLRTRLLEDEIILEPAKKLEIHFLPGEGIEPKKNTILKAIHLLEEKTGRNISYKITVHKNIPPGSGLGGGSSDAASLLVALNHSEKLDLTQAELMELGAQVGMDVPFFLSGYELAHGRHYGEILSLLPALPGDLKLRIELGHTAISTKEAFQKWDHSTKSSSSSPKTSAAFIGALKAQDSQGILKHLHNDFQSLFPYLKPNLKTGEHAVLSGSGSAFAVLHSRLERSVLSNGPNALAVALHEHDRKKLERKK